MSLCSNAYNRVIALDRLGSCLQEAMLMKTNLVLSLLAGVLLAGGAYAQSVAGLGAISGTVRDASGAAVPGAQVLVSNESKGIKRTVTTTEAGVFNAPSLPPPPRPTVAVHKPRVPAPEKKNNSVVVGPKIRLPDPPPGGAAHHPS